MRAGERFLRSDGTPPPDMKSVLDHGESRGGERWRSIAERIRQLPEHERDAVIEVLIEANEKHDPGAIARLEEFLNKKGIANDPRPRMNDQLRAQGPETRTAYATKEKGSAFREALRRFMLLRDS